jgi:hypothetical protein
MASKLNTMSGAFASRIDAPQIDFASSGAIAVTDLARNFNLAT